jgi:twitching motility protein PilJ
MIMLKKLNAAQLFPVLGPLLLVVLLATLVSAVRDRSPADGASAAELAALSQRLPRLSGLALDGEGAAFAELEAARNRLARLSMQVDSNAARERLARMDSQAGSIVAAREDVLALHAAASAMRQRTPDLLSATGSLAATLSVEDLAANQRFLERFELTLQRAQQDLVMLAGGVDQPRRAVNRLIDAESVMGQILDGLAGNDTGLGLRPVAGQAAGELNRVSQLYREVVQQLRAGLAASDGSLTAREALSGMQQTATELFPLLGAPADPGQASWLTPVLLLLSLAMLLGLIVLYWRAGDLRRAAHIQAQQNQRNQQAILRLLDEMGSLADGDLTVQATVSEDITGAIADSINFAIEALRELVLTIRDSSVLVDGAAKQTAMAAEGLARASERQSRQVASASESIGQVAGSIEEVSGNAERASDVARHSVDVAHKGGEAVRRTIAGMNTIRETIQDTSKRIKRLGESSQEIGNIVELINDIAEQTNILALNASIQASMAGEAGRGFAVVADEVQRLAERSANATRQIEVLVRTIQSDTNEAVVSMERSTTDVVGGALLAENAGAALEEIEQVSNQIASLVQNISSSAHQQTEVAANITHNMTMLREISIETVDGAGATASSIARLSELASQLRQTVAGFRLPDAAAESRFSATQIYRRLHAQSQPGEQAPRSEQTAAHVDSLRTRSG